ncbi:hypothetical protein [Niallia sp. NCCP-28]|uniref:hypothetical protein n=1 Tax=Niallia sp. NCCP-28 TaxID=2934712 RepID=UPI00208C7D61|nr:hypothetical protein [Niallia sp. NCCP-28]GKU82990.1 hypothetical protein NCCP28_23860 [Niallia sp. NCCP-28]
MEEKEYYLITTNYGRHLILAEDSIQAVKLWDDNRKKLYAEGERSMKKSPPLFTVERIGYESELIF